MALVDLVRQFRGIRALVVGDLMLDSYLEGSATRLCAEGPVPVVRKTADEDAPGGAANTAANLRALGADVVVVGIVGQDPAGTALRRTLEDRGVDLRGLAGDESVSTLHKMRILANGQYVVRYDAGDTRSASAEIRRQEIAQIDALLPHCDVVVISDYAYGAVSDQVIARIRDLRRYHSMPLVIDSKDLPRFSRARATAITPNHLEAGVLAGRTSGSEEPSLDELEEIGRRLLDRIDSEYAAITLAERGVLLMSRRDAPVHLPAHPVANPNDVGAGDSFTAAFTLTLAAGGEPAEAARVGIDAAGIAVRQRRTAVVQHQELLQRVSLGEQAVASSILELAERLRVEQERGRSVVFTNGVFDILHAGHVHFLREARSQGDILVVGVNSDAGARRLKGKNRPINSEHDRLALVAALDFVDYVVPFDEDTPAEMIRALHPNIHVKGGDYAGAELPEAGAVEEVGGKVVILPLIGGLSTSRMIERIIALAADAEVGARR